MRSGLVTPALVGDIDGFGAGALDDGDELHPLRLHLVSEEAIDRAAVMFVSGVDRAQDIEVDSVLAQEPPALHHFVEGASFAAIEPVRVMDLARAVDAQADQEIVLLEKGAPLVIEQDAVGLKGVLRRSARAGGTFRRVQWSAGRTQPSSASARLPAMPR